MSLVLSPLDVDLNADDQLERLERLTASVALITDFAEAFSMSERALWFRKVAKAHRHAGQLAKAAARLEAVALRRMAQLDPSLALLRDAGVNGANRGAARFFATMSDEVFFKHLDSHEYMSPLALKRCIAPQPPGAETIASRKKRDNARVAEVRLAAARIVDEHERNGRPFSTTSVADKVVNDLDLHGHGELVAATVSLLVRDHYRTESTTSSKLDPGFPKFVSFRERSYSESEEWPRCGHWQQRSASAASLQEVQWAIRHREDALAADAAVLKIMKEDARKAEANLGNKPLTTRFASLL